MDQTSPKRGSQHRDSAPQGRTFSRRIDCADAGRRAPFAVATRGGGMREPGGREHLRASIRD